MITIGVTGSFGTGKTTVARFFRDFGAVVMDADKIAHEALSPKTETYKKIIKIFGREALKKDKKIDRKKLGNIVFKNKTLLRRLCDVIHPYVIKKVKKGIKMIKRKKPDAVIILDIPLLIEADLLDLIDKLIVVRTDKKIEIQRCQGKTGLNKKEILARINAQVPLGKKIRFSDFVIDNSGTKEQTKREVRKIWEEIQQKIFQKRRI